MRRLLTALALIAVTIVAGQADVLANGDPASHVLPSREVFIPSDPSLCSLAGRRLDALTEATRRAGYPIKVGVIPTAEDLGTLYRLFGRAEAYARQLARELPPELFQKVRRGAARKRNRGGKGYRLLILMPGDLGIYNGGSKESRTLRRISVGSESTKEELARKAIEVVSKLSRMAGHRVRSPKPKAACPDIDVGSSSPPSSGSRPGSPSSVLIIAAPVAMLALALFLGVRGRRRADRGEAAG
jgi:hypothetical protein